MDESKRIRRNLWMFPLGTVGRDMIYSLFNNFLLTYVLFTRRLDAAQLSAVTESYLTTQLERGFSALDFYKSLLIPPDGMQ